MQGRWMPDGPINFNGLCQPQCRGSQFTLDPSCYDEGTALTLADDAAFWVRNSVMITPVRNVSDTHIQNRGWGTSCCMSSVGRNGIKALATPCTRSPENGLLPEISRIQEKIKE